MWLPWYITIYIWGHLFMRKGSTDWYSSASGASSWFVLQLVLVFAVLMLFVSVLHVIYWICNPCPCSVLYLHCHIIHYSVHFSVRSQYFPYTLIVHFFLLDAMVATELLLYYTSFVCVCVWETIIIIINFQWVYTWWQCATMQDRTIQYNNTHHTQ